MIIKNKNKKCSEIKINIDGNEIEKVKDFNYLGITLDDKLNWEKGIIKIKNQILRFVPMMYNLRRIINKDLLITIIKAKILPIIKYGLMIYGNKGNYNKKMDSINRILFKIIRIAIKDDLSIEEIESKYGIYTIEKSFKREWYKLIHRMIYNSYRLPEYFKKLIELKEGRNYIDIKVEYRNKCIGDRIIHNISANLWNKLESKVKKKEDLNEFLKEITF